MIKIAKTNNFNPVRIQKEHKNTGKLKVNNQKNESRKYSVILVSYHVNYIGTN